MDELANQIAAMRQESALDRQLVKSMHAENQTATAKQTVEFIKRFDRLEDKMGDHAERVSVLEEITRTLKAEWTMLRERYHKMINDRQSDDSDGDGMVVKRADLRWLILVFAGGIGTMYAIGKLLGKL